MFWKLFLKNLGEGMWEIYRSFSKAAFVHSRQQIIPQIQSDDLVPCKAAVRAQGLRSDGKLVDDILTVKAPHALHVCNAPSPAAIASLEIGRAIVEQISSPAVKTTISLSH